MLSAQDVFSDYRDNLTGRPLTDEMVRLAEARLGYKLPAAYLDLLRQRNGGYLKHGYFPIPQESDYPDTHALVAEIMGLGEPRGIDASLGSVYLIEEWEYPAIGVVIASDGHTAVMLDYRQCGVEGEPQVVYIDVELGPEPIITWLAPNFETFISGLTSDIDR